ncbi:hypothetical protein [Streptomyces sp. NBC_00038]|uniref:hypothetical protein n=1 Tax=Streptomyces sp. NBC_00038 TaxID=2903615 RepID=UPI002254767D|nr:hypothetical protein [Streptomyces sp. NBC_00038]MCX5561839.1 hypothetical protein [Streptomyces sp. NBC_00038]
MERLDQGGGWCGVFWQRDPDGMRACLDGWEVPPWDVVEALLQDVAAEYGDRAAAQESERARKLHGASLAAYDARPGGRDNLGDRLDVLLREQRYAGERQVELSRLLHSAASQEEADSIRLDLAWAHDDHERATARCAEIRRRMENLDRRDLRTHAEGALNLAAGGAGDVFWTQEAEGGAEPSGGAGARQGAGGRPAEARHGGLGPGQAARRRSGVPERTGPRSPFADPGVPDDGASSGASSRSGAYAPAARLPSNDPAGADPGAYASEYGSRARRDSAYAADGLSPSPGVHAPHAQHDGAYAPDARRDDGSRAAAAQHDGTYAPDRHRDRESAHATDAQPDAFYAPPAHSDTPQPPTEDQTPPTTSKRSKRRTRGSARFAGMMDPEAETAPVVAPETAAPAAPAPAARGGRSPRGARFAGVAEEPAQPPRTQPMDAEARQDTVETVRTLIRLRSEGRSGEAHAVLVEAAYWPAPRFPLLAAELHRAGLDADWATLLWEAASLPADRLVAAADALVAAGRTADGQQMLRQGVARPAPEIGAAVLSLAEEGRRREIGALLGAYVRMRTPEEAARSAEADPQRLVPLLLEAAKGVSEERHWDLVHALRVAGFTA